MFNDSSGDSDINQDEENNQKASVSLTGVEQISSVDLEDEMKRAYLDYAMSVIVARALPDVRDGLKPVHRRILYAMHENGFFHDKPYKKSARIVGDVIGKYHPHGDQAVYDSLVRMAQDFSMRLLLLDGQGNFGSLDGDPPAAMRYTETRMHKVTSYMLQDIDKNTVAFQSNYDNSESEPTVLPAMFPNLLANGTSGIAVGMATNIPPHNLGELIDACVALLDDSDLSDVELMDFIHGPDFPTGALILGRAGIINYIRTGRGSITMRSVVNIEETKSRNLIVVSEIPFMVNKTTLIEKIADLAREKRIEGIYDIRDESDRQGIRIVIEIKKDTPSDIILNQLYKLSPLQSVFSANILALNKGRPELMGVRQALTCFLDFRQEVVVKRTKFNLKKARERAHILIGLSIAISSIDDVVNIIRQSATPEEARSRLMNKKWAAQDMRLLLELVADPQHTLSEEGTYQLSHIQAQAILDLKLQRLTTMGRDDIHDQLKKLAKEIEEYLYILKNKAEILNIIKSELKIVKKLFASKRKTKILESFDDNVDEESFIQPEPMIVTISYQGYIKRVHLDTYRAQNRGGKGRSGMTTKEDDFVVHLFSANTLDGMLFFLSNGLVHYLRVWKLPQALPQARGKALTNLLAITHGERITSIVTLQSDSIAQKDKKLQKEQEENSLEDEDEIDTPFLIFVTKDAQVRRNRLSDFQNINRAGKIAMKLDNGNEIIGVSLCCVDDDVFLITKMGRFIRFSVIAIRVFSGRTSVGVRGARLDENDEIISITIVKNLKISSDERYAYLKMKKVLMQKEDVNDMLNPSDANSKDHNDEDDKNSEISSFQDNIETENREDYTEITELSKDRFEELKKQEEFILTVTKKGFAKRTSAFYYRQTGRGGKGGIAMNVAKRDDRLVAALPVREDDDVIVVTNKGTLIRSPVKNIKQIGRSGSGVILMRLDDSEWVVSVERVGETSNNCDAIEQKI